MESTWEFAKEPIWTANEKKTARRAFDRAFERHCAAIATEARRMLGAGPIEIWRVHDYLSGQRKIVDRIYDYRYSRLLDVFARLLRDGWLTEADLVGLQEEKIDTIKRYARL
jgi:Photoprotection regulator fluorescence recovery protein